MSAQAWNAWAATNHGHSGGCNDDFANLLAGQQRRFPDWSRSRKLKDIHSYPKGFPRLAAQQTMALNGSIHRRFEMEGELLITHLEYRVTLASERLSEWYTSHPDAGHRLSAWQRHGASIPSNVEEHDRLIEDLENAWLRYHKLLMSLKERRTLLDVHPGEVKGLYGGFLASQDVTDDDVFTPAYAPPQDFCSTVLQQVRLPIRRFLYSRPYTWLVPKLKVLKINVNSDIYLWTLHAISLLPKGLLKVFQVFCTSGLLLLPIEVLLFQGLNKHAMYWVVVASVFVFSAVLVLGHRGYSGHGSGVLHGLVAAYTAVLVTFLAQLGT